MDLQVLVSKKGTRVVTASNLYIALELPQSQYSKQLSRWITDTYEFNNGIRRPERMKDFARRSVAGSPVPDYYLAVEFAKLVALRSNSKKKLKYAKYLFSMEEQSEEDARLNTDQVLAMLELTKAMGLVSCQTASEQRHLDIYEERNDGKPNQWWKFREKLLGYSSGKLQSEMKKRGKSGNGKSQRQMLMQLDKHEMVRTGVIDLFMSMGKTASYARKLGDLAKSLAKELSVDVFDDRSGVPAALLPNVNKQVAGELKNNTAGEFLAIWQ
ncbi:MAG: hypothetical protein GYB31_15955 [Bacteroidetes bacterium]|nr:hypothetical protein [Bacteroidota bacterium]